MQRRPCLQREAACGKFVVIRLCRNQALGSAHFISASRNQLTSYFDERSRGSKTVPASKYFPGLRGRAKPARERLTEIRESVNAVASIKLHKTIARAGDSIRRVWAVASVHVIQGHGCGNPLCLGRARDGGRALEGQAGGGERSKPAQKQTGSLAWA